MPPSSRLSHAFLQHRTWIRPARRLSVLVDLRVPPGQGLACLSPCSNLLSDLNDVRDPRATLNSALDKELVDVEGVSFNSQFPRQPHSRVSGSEHQPRVKRGSRRVRSMYCITFSVPPISEKGTLRRENNLLCCLRLSLNCFAVTFARFAFISAQSAGYRQSD